MIIAVNDKVHIVYRALYENSTRRHFIGEVTACEGALCRLEGYAFVHDAKSGLYSKKTERRTTIVDLAESGYIVNVIDSSVNIDAVTYRYLSEVGLAATDGNQFILDINEFGVKS